MSHKRSRLSLPLDAQTAQPQTAPVSNTQSPPLPPISRRVTFEAGKSYYIWTTVSEPIIGSVAPMLGSNAYFYVNVVAQSAADAPRFRIHLALEAADNETLKVTKYTTTFPGDPKDAQTYKADATYVPTSSPQQA